MKFFPAGFLQKPLLAFTAMLTFLTVLQSCKKEKNPGGGDAGIEKNLVINFQPGTIPIADVDSATVVFKKQGSQQFVLQRFDKGSNFLNVLTDGLSAGDYTAEIYIYTKKAADNSSRMYTRSAGFTLPLSSNLTLTAPSGAINDVWKPHIVLAAANNDVVVVLAADNAEPYFDIRVKDNKWDYFYVERAANNRNGGMNELVAADSWECQNGCYTNDKLIINSTAFVPFTNTVKTKQWNNGEVFVIVADSDSQAEQVFFYVYDK
ncbi:MAG TPA: hypothetical protein VD996_17620 [Chitinophagaceae bacterium]|nr:hypothetical protein [Chitinophagaceae bacterium]